MMKLKTKYLLGGVSIALGAALIGSSTYAFFVSQTSSSNNEFAIGDISMQVIDVGPKGKEKIMKENAQPGDTFSVRKQVKNTGNLDINSVGLNIKYTLSSTNDIGSEMDIHTIKYGDNTKSTNELIDLGYDLNNDGKVTFQELTKKELNFGGILAKEEKELLIDGVFYNSEHSQNEYQSETLTADFVFTAK